MATKSLGHQIGHAVDDIQCLYSCGSSCHAPLE
jgi:hypothetical protein